MAQRAVIAESVFNSMIQADRDLTESVDRDLLLDERLGAQATISIDNL